MNGFKDLDSFASTIMNAKIYRDEDPYPYPRLFWCAIGNNLLLLDGTACLC